MVSSFRAPFGSYKASEAQRWRYAGAIGKVWRLMGGYMSVEVQRAHVELLREVKKQLMPFAVAETAEGCALLNILAGLAGGSSADAGGCVHRALKPKGPEALEGSKVRGPMSPICAGSAQGTTAPALGGPLSHIGSAEGDMAALFEFLSAFQDVEEPFEGEFDRLWLFLGAFQEQRKRRKEI